MKKVLKVLALLLAMAVCFLLGWRVMPRVWPAIKTQVVYRVLPQLQPRLPRAHARHEAQLQF